VEEFSVAGQERRLCVVNEAFAYLLGRAPDDVIGRSLLEFVHPADLADIVSGLAQVTAGATEVPLENRFLRRDGSTVHLRWVARPLRDTDLWAAIGTADTDVHGLLAERRSMRAQLDLALGRATAATWELDLSQRRFSWEPRAAEVLGVADGSVPASPEDLAAVVHLEDGPSLLLALQDLIGVGSTEVEVRVGYGAGLRHLSLRGRILDRDSHGRPMLAVGLVFDVSTEKAMEEQMLRMAMSDGLTALPNRRAFDQALRGEWRRCTRGHEPLSVVMIDVDDFKHFNEVFTHLVGDDALCAITRALTENLNRAGDFLARFGGDEFAVVLPGVDGSGALIVGHRLVAAVRAVSLRQIADQGLSISVGTASWHPGDPVVKPAELLARADEALCAAKLDGKNRAVAYETSLASRDILETAIARGLTQGEFQLYYQPVIALAADTVTGFEALIRWNRPGHGLIAPDSFIPAAEASTLICDLGRWALREAACQLATWTRLGLDADEELRVAVNISGRHVASPALVADVAAALNEAGIAPRRLEVELTETALVDDVLADTHLAQVQALGVTVAIDDFGTGYTSVGQLPHLPADTLKIDRSFVASADPRHRALVKLMIGAAHAFDLGVVAEGVEDPETLQGLRDLGCDAVQGYLIARPMPAERVASWLAEWRAGTHRTTATTPAP
jgi:diguanylate cyclase (GGDEF)-like protein/PAS domain S-box-containing protein